MHSGESWTKEDEAAAEEAIGYTFRDKNLLRTAFTHNSYTNLRGEENNERLEFLGDAVLQLAVTESLYLHSAADEGELTRIRKNYVARPALERAADRAGLMRFMRYSGGESNIAGKTASNLFEAVTAAIYLDGGMEHARAFLRHFLTEAKLENYKSALQEYTQEREKKTPEYSGEDTEQGYRCTVTALGRSATAEAASKKLAEQDAAKALYEILTKGKRI